MVYKAPSPGRGDRRLNTTNYDHPQETNLLDLHRAMEYNLQGQPVIRTTSGASVTSNDAFGRLRVTNPFTLYESFHRYQDNGKISVYQTADAISQFDANNCCIAMTVGTTSGAKVYRETLRTFAYQPGKSLQQIISFNMGEPKANVRQRVGLFDVDNGVYFQSNSGALSLVLRSNSSGTVSETVIPQASWNVDPLDGTGISTLVIDATKSQIFWTDYEWLGVGSVRSGFVIDGTFVHCHTFHHANNITGTYMQTACLPGRVEIENLGPTTGNTTYRQICFTVISEGGYELRGRPTSVGHTIAAPYTMSNPNVVYPILSIRLKSNRLGAIVVPKNFSIGVQAAANFRYLLLQRAVTTGGTWISGGDSSSVEYNLTATSLTDQGSTSEMGYIMASNQTAISPQLQQYPFQIQLERNTFTNTCYEFVIAMVSDGNNQKVHASVNWEEFT